MPREDYCNQCACTFVYLHDEEKKLKGGHSFLHDLSLNPKESLPTSDVFVSVEEHLRTLSMSDKGLVETFARQNTDRAFIIEVL